MSLTKKRILIIDGPLGAGGAERVLIDILRHIDYDRYEVDLALICRGGTLIGEVPPQVNIIELWHGYSLSYKLAYRLSRWLRCNLLFKHKMNSRLLRRDYDAEISFLEGMPLKLHACRRRSGAVRITWVHCDLYRFPYEAGQFYRGEELRAYNSMDYVVNVSRDAEDAFRLRFPRCTSQLKVVYNPIDREKIVAMSALKPDGDLPKHDNRLNIITVGRLTPPKKPSRLIELASMAHRAALPVRFVWVGTGELFDSCVSECRNKGLDDILSFVGFKANPFPWIKNADLMIVPSDYEGFCLVICEAMCLGVPVISTRTSGPTEIIGDNRYGIITDISAAALLDALKKLIDNPEARNSLAVRALARPDDYSVERCLNQLYSLIDQGNTTHK